MSELLSIRTEKADAALGQAVPAADAASAPAFLFIFSQNSSQDLCPRILCRVTYALRLIVSDAVYINTQHLEYFEHFFSEVSECYGAVMRIVALYQNVTVESAHLRNCEDTNASEGFCRYRKNFTLCDVSNQFCVGCALQTVECDVSRYDISFQSSLCYLFRQISCHDELIFHLTEGQFAGRSISAVEAHESIIELIIIFSFDLRLIHISRYGIVDIQQGNCIFGYNASDKLRQCAVDIHLTGYRDSSSSQTAVDIARYKSELCLECRPAFSCDRNVFAGALVSLYPV